MSILLRDGSKTQDARLDRLVNFDDRSRNYPVRALISDRKMRSYSWRCTKHLDQGRDGSCVGFGTAHKLIARPAEVLWIDAEYAKKRIYWEAQKIDPWKGGNYPGAFPRYEGSDVLSALKILKAYGWIDSFHWGFGLEDLIYGVGHIGPATLGIPWKKGMRDGDKNGFIHATGKTEGGHCIFCKAVNIAKAFFTLHQSWGGTWNGDGDCKISFEDMETLLHEDGEAAFCKGQHLEPKL